MHLIQWCNATQERCRKKECKISTDSAIIWDNVTKSHTHVMKRRFRDQAWRVDALELSNERALWSSPVIQINYSGSLRNSRPARVRYIKGSVFLRKSSGCCVATLVRNFRQLEKGPSLYLHDLATTKIRALLQLSRHQLARDHCNYSLSVR